jgi:hypothetical protein
MKIIDKYFFINFYKENKMCVLFIFLVIILNHLMHIDSVSRILLNRVTGKIETYESNFYVWIYILNFSLKFFGGIFFLSKFIDYKNKILNGRCSNIIGNGLSFVIMAVILLPM